MTMLREAHILVPTARAADPATHPPADALAAILADDRRWLAGFLVPDDEMIALTPTPLRGRRGESRV